MSKAHSSNLDESHDSGIGTEKESEEVKNGIYSQNSPLASSYSSLRRHQHFGKISFKSLTALGARDSLENLQKIRRRGDAGARRLLFNRGSSSSASGEKRAHSRKKCHRKRFDKSNVSEVNIRKVTDELAGIAEQKEKLVSVVSPRKLGGGGKASGCNQTDCPAASPTGVGETVSEAAATAAAASACKFLDSPEILHCLEKLRLDQSSASQEEVKSSGAPSTLGSGDISQELDDLADAESCYGQGMAACAQILDDSKRRSVQWKREVDVIYYAGDADGGKVVRRENEPLREEAEQQARRNRFIQLALTKNLLSNVSACQLRDPWLVVLPK